MAPCPRLAIVALVLPFAFAYQPSVLKVSGGGEAKNRYRFDRGPEGTDDGKRAFSHYYKRQRVCAKEDWDSFYACLQRPQPIDFRINLHHANSPWVISALRVALEEEARGRGGSGQWRLTPLPILKQGTGWRLQRWQEKQGGGGETLPIHGEHELSPVLEFLHEQQLVGALSRQEVVSMLPPLYLDPRNGDDILDACASPGSKFLQVQCLLFERRLAAAANGRGDEDRGELSKPGLLVANELERRRVSRLRARVQIEGSPEGAAATVLLNCDARSLPAFGGLLYDGIMVDVPCSGDGTLRKWAAGDQTQGVGEEDASQRQGDEESTSGGQRGQKAADGGSDRGESDQDTQSDGWASWDGRAGLSLHKIQLDILHHSLGLLKEGGRLVFSTCTLDPLQNEAVIAAALHRIGAAEAAAAASDGCGSMGGAGGETSLVPMEDIEGIASQPGLTEWLVPDPRASDVLYHSWEEVPLVVRHTHAIQSNMFPPGRGVGGARVRAQLEKGCRRYLPHDNDSGGFFIAVFEKRTGGGKAAPKEDRGGVHRVGGSSREVDGVGAGALAREHRASRIKELRSKLRRHTPHQPTGREEEEEEEEEEDAKEGDARIAALEATPLQASSRSIEDLYVQTTSPQVVQSICDFWGLPGGEEQGLRTVAGGDRGTTRANSGAAAAVGFAPSKLLWVSTDRTARSKIVLVSAAVDAFLRQRWAPNSKVSATLRRRLKAYGATAFWRIKAGYGSGGRASLLACEWQLSQEALPILLPFITRRRLFLTSLSDFEALLAAKVCLPTRRLREMAVQGTALGLDSCLLYVDPTAAPAPTGGEGERELGVGGVVVSFTIPPAEGRLGSAGAAAVPERTVDVMAVLTSQHLRVSAPRSCLNALTSVLLQLRHGE